MFKCLASNPYLPVRSSHQPALCRQRKCDFSSELTLDCSRGESSRRDRRREQRAELTSVSLEQIVCQELEVIERAIRRNCGSALSLSLNESISSRPRATRHCDTCANIILYSLFCQSLLSRSLTHSLISCPAFDHFDQIGDRRLPHTRTHLRHVALATAP